MAANKTKRPLACVSPDSDNEHDNIPLRKLRCDNAADHDAQKQKDEDRKVFEEMIRIIEAKASASSAQSEALQRRLDLLRSRFKVPSDILGRVILEPIQSSPATYVSRLIYLESRKDVSPQDKLDFEAFQSKIWAAMAIRKTGFCGKAMMLVQDMQYLHLNSLTEDSEAKREEYKSLLGRELLYYSLAAKDPFRIIPELHPRYTELGETITKAFNRLELACLSAARKEALKEHLLADILPMFDRC